MRRVLREELVDWVTWTERRPSEEQAARAAKQARRVVIRGPGAVVLTFLFENHQTVRWQIQEMMRIERIVREADVQHELETYNELIGGPGELGCTLLVAIEPADRPALLAAWGALPARLYVRTAAGEAVPASWDARQVDPRRLSSVQYLRFRVGGRPPVAIGVAPEAGDPDSLRALAREVSLDADQVRALEGDLDDQAAATAAFTAS